MQVSIVRFIRYISQTTLFTAVSPSCLHYPCNRQAVKKISFRKILLIKLSHKYSVCVFKASDGKGDFGGIQTEASKWLREKSYFRKNAFLGYLGVQFLVLPSVYQSLQIWFGSFYIVNCHDECQLSVYFL